MDATLSKEERLCGKTVVGNLMSKGQWGHHGHFKYCVLHREEDGLNRIMVSVPKRYFKRAVKRNLLKRRIREAYRTQKGTASTKGNDILFFYNSAEMEEYGTIRDEMAAMLKKI